MEDAASFNPGIIPSTLLWNMPLSTAMLENTFFKLKVPNGMSPVNKDLPSDKNKLSLKIEIDSWHERVSIPPIQTLCSMLLCQGVSRRVVEKRVCFYLRPHFTNRMA